MKRSGDKLKNSDALFGCLCALGCESLYGMSYVFTKQASEMSSSLALLGWRFLIAMVCILICMKMGWMKTAIKGKELRILLRLVICYPIIYFVFETLGIRNTTASESGVFLACIPVASMTASTLILKIKPKKIQLIGILITLIGVISTVLAVGFKQGLSFIGYGFMALAVLAYALYSVYVEKAAIYTSAEITVVMMISGALVFIPTAVVESVIHGTFAELIRLPVQYPQFRSAVLFQGIGCSVLAFFFNNMAISKIGVNRTASFIGISTVVSIVLGALLLKEVFNLGQILGAVIILAGVYTANFGLKEHK